MVFHKTVNLFTTAETWNVLESNRVSVVKGGEFFEYFSPQILKENYATLR